MSHPVHPKCPGCYKSLYKAFERGKPVKKTDAWAFCRNPACKLSGAEGLADVSKARGSALENEESSVPEHIRAAKRGRFKAKLKAFKKSRAAGESWTRTIARVHTAEVNYDGASRFVAETHELEKRWDSETANVTEYSGKKRRRASVAREPDTEPKPVRDARARLKPLAAMLAPVGTERTAVGLILAILNQEMGAKSAANMLIDEMKLTDLFGIEKF